MIKIKYSDFQKLPTSDKEESEKLNKRKKLKNKYKNKKGNLLTINNKWIIIILIIISIICIFFAFTKLHKNKIEIKNNNNKEIKSLNLEK